MGKKDKEHRKKVASRNARIKQEQEKYRKMQKEMLMKLIEEEKKKGMFDNIPQIPSMDGPTIDGFAGPSI
jgi:hypothetical protein